MNLKTVSVILAITLLVMISLTESKRPSRRKHKPTRTSIFKLPSLFGRSERGKKVEPAESKRVYYYSVPRTTVRPRIILGDELDFTQLGIKDQHKKPIQQSPSHHASLSTFEHDLFDDDIPIPQPRPPGRYPPRGPPPRGPRRKRPRSRGPGYRLENRPWNYVIEDDYRPQKEAGGYAVMPYLKKAGKNLVGAYRAAVIQSGKIAHFTGHAASKYIKGVRTLISSHERIDKPTTKKLDTPSNSVTESLKPEVMEVDLEELDHDSPEPTTLPKVYLDWGGSFWRFFYNKSKDMPPPKKSN